MKMETVKASDFGLEETKALEISNMFKPMLDQMVELESDYNKVVVMPINDESIGLAKDLRKRYVKVRTGTAAIHKDLKSFYLQGGRFVDGWKNAQEMAAKGNEEKLLAIEKHYENIEAERIENLIKERQDKLSKYEMEMDSHSLGAMTEDVFKNLLTGAKVNHEARIEAERKSAEEQQAKEKEVERTRKIMQQENQRMAKELRKKEEEERAKKEAEEKKVQAELNKGDAAKVKDLISDLTELKTKYTFKSSKNTKMYSDVGLLIDKVIKHINGI
jgi:hypothetical protein